MSENPCSFKFNLKRRTMMYKSTIRKVPALLLAAGILSLAGAPAYAVNGEWTTAASACVPDESAVGKFRAENASFEFTPAQFGSIGARCNITDPADLFSGQQPIWDGMLVTYNDPDGAGSGARVRVHLRRVALVGSNNGVSSTISTFDSNLHPAGQQWQVQPFAHAFDFVNYAYYLSIVLDRASQTAATPRVEAIRFSRSPVQ
jgi:hypothetical protein